MLTPKQEEWVNHLSDEKTITILPFDPTSEEKFERIKMRIQEALGMGVMVEHHGATSLGISGQDEIDVYIPVPPSKFDSMIELLKQLFSETRSLYPLERARFAVTQDGKKIDLFVINTESDGWKSMLLFESALRAHPAKLEAYRVLKESGNGLTMREYYRRKNLFINEILYGSAKTAATNPNKNQ